LDTPAPDLAYLFKHVVTQEVAYGLLLSAQRRQLHRAVAEWYEQTQADDLASLYPPLPTTGAEPRSQSRRLPIWSWLVNRPCASAPSRKQWTFSPKPYPGREQYSPLLTLCGRRACIGSWVTPTRGWAACPRAGNMPNRRWRCWAGRCPPRGYGCWPILPGRHFGTGATGYCWGGS
jgi:hypothetical protein